MRETRKRSALRWCSRAAHCQTCCLSQRHNRQRSRCRPSYTGASSSPHRARLLKAHREAMELEAGLRRWTPEQRQWVFLRDNGELPRYPDRWLLTAGAKFVPPLRQVDEEDVERGVAGDAAERRVRLRVARDDVERPAIRDSALLPVVAPQALGDHL